MFITMSLSALPTTPSLMIPEPLRGIEPDTFAEHTMSVRLPEITLRLLKEGDWSQKAVVALQALADSMPHGAIRPLQDNGAPDANDWERNMLPYLGQIWLQAPWFVAENYFFRRILEATGYYQPGPGQGVDPYTTQKRQGLAIVLDGLSPLCAQIDALHTISRSSRLQLQEPFTHLLQLVIWGNQADLSMWQPGREGHPDRPESDSLDTRLLDQDASEVSRYLISLTKRPVRVDFILDNSGLELAYDLALADFLLASGLAHSIWFHVKPHPTYVSDVTVRDLMEILDFLEATDDRCVCSLVGRLRSYLSGQILRLKTNFFWTSPLSGWEMPSGLRQELSESDLIISKGDANYRRWVGDRHWHFTTSLQKVLSYLPAPLVALRVLKAEVVIGLQPGQQEEMDRIDPKWLFNGRWGIIQFTG